MSERYAVTVKLVINADSKDEAGFAAVQIMASAISAGMPVEPMFAVSVQTLDDAAREAREAQDKPETDEPESPKAEDVFGRIMSAPDVQ